MQNFGPSASNVFKSMDRSSYAFRSWNAMLLHSLKCSFLFLLTIISMMLAFAVFYTWSWNRNFLCNVSLITLLIFVYACFSVSSIQIKVMSSVIPNNSFNFLSWRLNMIWGSGSSLMSFFLRNLLSFRGSSRTYVALFFVKKIMWIIWIISCQFFI